MPIMQAQDGTVLDEQGKILLFSLERFIRDIVDGDCCFICGAHPDSRPFNSEHVIPNWILAEHGIYSSRIVLPNNASFSYGRYAIPCCRDCNSLLGETLEAPVSRLISEGYNAVGDYFRTEGPMLFFRWLNLIFLKTYLKDREFRAHLDYRAEAERLADRYCWEDFHHIHCIARSFYTGAQLDDSVLGTLAVLPSRAHEFGDGFDYGDNYATQTMMLQVKNIGFVTVLNDCCASGHILTKLLRAVRGPLGPLQLREFMARLAYANLIIKCRPTFHSAIASNGTYVISAKIPNDNGLEPTDDAQFGELFYSCAKSAIPETDAGHLASLIESGRWTFIVDEKGQFVDQFEILEAAANARPSPQRLD